jgi:hypothetical protein
MEGGAFLMVDQTVFHCHILRLRRGDTLFFYKAENCKLGGAAWRFSPEDLLKDRQAPGRLQGEFPPVFRTNHPNRAEFPCPFATTQFPPTRGALAT